MENEENKSVSYIPDFQNNIAFEQGLIFENIKVNTLFESMSEGVVVINRDSRILFINKRLEELTGFEKSEIIGKNLDILIPQNFHYKHDTYVNNYFNNPKRRSMGTNLDLMATRKDFSTFPVDISLSFLQIDNNTFGIAYITDITSRKKTENEIKIKNNELESYARIVAHDLNSTLQGVVGFSEYLINSKNDLSDEEFNSYLSNISLSGKKMTSIINDMLLFVTLKKENVHKVEITIKDIVASVLQRLKFLIESKSAQIIVDQKLINCLGYSLWIEEVIYNLISNALKYGGNPPVVEISSELLNDGMVKYNIKDNGKGISNELIGIIFEDNNQRDTLTKGFGIGLPIVKMIIEKLDGNLSVSTKLNEGSIFSFCLKAKSGS